MEEKKAQRRSGGRGTMFSRKILTHYFVTLSLFGVTCVMLFPIFSVIATSFMTEVDIAAGKIATVSTLDNYRELFGFGTSGFREDVLLYLVNSVTIALWSTALSLVVATPAAYAFARVRHAGAGFGMILLIGLRLLPPIALVIPFFFLMRMLSLIDTKTALVICYTAFNLPFIILLLYGFFKEMPRELEEAAFVDGASRWQTFFRIILPLSGPGLAAAAIFSVIHCWNDFLFALVLTNHRASTLPVLISGFVTELGVSWGIMMAAGTLVVLPVLVFAVFTQKHLLRGMVIGAVKG